MAQTGFTPIQLYSTSTAAAAPVAGNLTNSTLGSELAINITDGKLFYKDNANAVQVIGWKTVPTTAGGTGLTTYTAGDLSYYASGTTFTKLAIGTIGQILTSTGSAPQWSTLSGVAVTTFSAGTTGFTPNSATSGAITLAGTLITSNGGTGLSSYTAGDLSYYASGTTLTKLGIGTTGRFLSSTGSAPQWSAPAALTKTDDTNVTLTLGGSASTALLNAASLTLGWTGQLATSRGGTGLSVFTANQVFYASSTSAIGQSANLTFNGTTLTANTIGAFTLGGTIAGGGNQINNVIIGTSTPLAGSFTTLSASGVATFSAGTVSAPAITTTGDTNTGIFFPAADTIAFTEGGAESMRIDSSGNVAIGTTTTTNSKFTVVASTGGTGGIRVETQFGSSYFGNFTNYPAMMYDGASLKPIIVYDTNNNANILYTNNTEKMRITSTGGVNIGGTSDPGAGNLSLTGNVVIATSGKGIDFSATAGTGTSELLADYEEGTWTGTISVNNFSGTTPTTLSGTYTKIGRTVQITLTLFAGGSNFSIGAGVRSDITGLPYTIGSTIAFSVAGTTGVYGNARASGTTITMEAIASSAAMFMQFTYQV